MSVFDLQVGESGKIMRISSQGAAASRLSAIGFSNGKRLTVLGFSLFKSSVLVAVNSTRVALRKSVAECVEVERCR
ncbi:MAG: ferrous iron transport protein A [Candidatus Coproplasma sp.]